MPVNQPGALALVGSGEYLPEAQLLEAELLRLGISRGKSNTYIQIPTAAGKEGEDRSTQQEACRLHAQEQPEEAEAGRMPRQ